MLESVTADSVGRDARGRPPFDHAEGVGPCESRGGSRHCKTSRNSVSSQGQVRKGDFSNLKAFLRFIIAPVQKIFFDAKW